MLNEAVDESWMPPIELPVSYGKIYSQYHIHSLSFELPYDLICEPRAESKRWCTDIGLSFDNALLPICLTQHDLSLKIIRAACMLHGMTFLTLGVYFGIIAFRNHQSPYPKYCTHLVKHYFCTHSTSVCATIQQHILKTQFIIKSAHDLKKNIDTKLYKLQQFNQTKL